LLASVRVAFSVSVYSRADHPEPTGAARVDARVRVGAPPGVPEPLPRPLAERPDTRGSAAPRSRCDLDGSTEASAEAGAGGSRTVPLDLCTAAPSSSSGASATAGITSASTAGVLSPTEEFSRAMASWQTLFRLRNVTGIGSSGHDGISPYSRLCPK